MGIKEINIKVNVNLANKNIGIKCEADKDLTLADIIRVADSLSQQHITLLQEYSLQNPEVNIETVTLNDLHKS